MIFNFQENTKLRLDIYLLNEINKTMPNISRSFIQKMIKESMVKLNNDVICNKNKLLKYQDTIYIDDQSFDKFEKNNIYDQSSYENLKPINVDLKIMYEDDELLVIDKPKGLSSHGGRCNIEKNLVNALLYKYQNLSDLAGSFRPGIVHRLDKDTTGLMIIAKNNYAHQNLSEQIKSKACIRKYKALCFYESYEDKGIITEYMRKSLKYYNKFEICQEDDIGSKHSITEFEVHSFLTIKNMNFAIVEFSLKTGRTHQIRLHSLHNNFPILGDKIYCNSRDYHQKYINSLFESQTLDSYFIEFTHPKTGKKIQIKKNNEDFFQDCIKKIENYLLPT